MTSGWPPTVSSPVQTKWWDQAHWGCHFLTPPKVIHLFLLVKCFCFLAKPILVIGICQDVNGFTVFQQLLGSKHMPHTWHKRAGRAVVGADNQDPCNSGQALRPGRGCWGRNGRSAIQKRSAPLRPPAWHTDETFCVWRGDSPVKNFLCEVWFFFTRNRAHLSNSAWNNTGRPAKECPLSHAHLDRR